VTNTLAYFSPPKKKITTKTPDQPKDNKPGTTYWWKRLSTLDLLAPTF